MKDAKIAISSVTIPYSWFNITQAYNNNMFQFTWYGSSTTVYTVTLPNGFYSVSDVNNYLENFMIANKLYLIDSNGLYVYYIQLYTSVTYYSNQILCFPIPISLPVGYTAPVGWPGYPAVTSTPLFTILNNKFQSYLGFTFGNYPSVTQITSFSVLSNLLSPVGSTVNSITVRCSLVNNASCMPTDIMDSFPIENSSFGSNLNYTPTFEKWVSLNNGTYSSLIIYFVDQNFNTIYMNDPNVSVTLLIRQK